MSGEPAAPISRRRLLRMIAAAAGSSAAYRAMASLELVPESDYRGPIALDAPPPGTSVLILGAGLAGLVAALELRKAGYQVQVLEYNQRAGGRNWTLRGGDRYTELGGYAQTCEFDAGLYLNPGPWRLPYHHGAILDYCKRLGVKLEPFVQVNYNAWLHSPRAFGGKPQRFRQVQADFHGHVAELLAKATSQHKLDQAVSREDRELLLESLKKWGALDQRYRYTGDADTSFRRGFARDPNGGTIGEPLGSQPVGLHQVLESRLWQYVAQGNVYPYQTTLFQPVGGMDMISRAFVREVGELIRYGCKVTAIAQDQQRVTVTYADTAGGGAPQQASADWCLCTIPASVLGQMQLQLGAPMLEAINALSYQSAIKVGLQAKRRFWEQDEAIYGGISYTDQPNRMIGYPSADFFGSGKGILLGAYVFGSNAIEFTALEPAERVRQAIACGRQIHAQYDQEIENGISVAWHRVPWILGCAAGWDDALRARHYQNLCRIDGRVLLAGEHVSYIPAWQEGAILSSLDAIGRLHRRIKGG